MSEQRGEDLRQSRIRLVGNAMNALAVHVLCPGDVPPNVVPKSSVSLRVRLNKRGMSTFG